MRDFVLHYALLTGILFFVGRLHVFPSLSDAFIAGVLATATAATVLFAFDRLSSTTQKLPSAAPAKASSPRSDV